MAESIFMKILDRENSLKQFKIDSAGLLDYHQGELADSRMRFHAAKRGYTIVHRSRPVTKADFETFDWIIGMDDQNIRGLKQLIPNALHKEKIFLMTDFCQQMDATHVPDPYYGGDQGFENVINLLEDACEGLFLMVNGKW